MPLAVRHRGSAQPAVGTLSDIEARRIEDAFFMAALQERSPEEMVGRFAEGHRAYVAFVHGQPAAWGWVATRRATVGELGFTFEIPDGDRYLWNFVTLKAFRRMGIYRMLLDAIVEFESLEAERFWIAYAPENHASGAGIRNAGFDTVAELSFDAEQRAAVHSLAPGGGALAAHMLGLPESAAPLAPCWICVRAGRTGHACATGTCQCDYQRPETAPLCGNG